MMIPPDQEDVDAQMLSIVENLSAEQLLGIEGIREIIADEYEHEIDEMLAELEERNNPVTRQLIYGP